MTEDEAWDELERKQAKKWDTSDMAHRSGGLNVEQKPVVYQCPRCATSMEVDLSAKPLKREQENPKLQLDAIERAYFHGKQQGIAESEAVKRLWVGLTDDEIIDAFDPFLNNIEKGRAIEQRLKEKNT